MGLGKHKERGVVKRKELTPVKKSNHRIENFT